MGLLPQRLSLPAPPQQPQEPQPSKEAGVPCPLGARPSTRRDVVDILKHRAPSIGNVFCADPEAGAGAVWRVRLRPDGAADLTTRVALAGWGALVTEPSSGLHSPIHSGADPGLLPAAGDKPRKNKDTEASFFNN